MGTPYRHPHRQHRPQKSGLFLILRDVILLIVSLNVFALFHHVIPVKLTPVGGRVALADGTPQAAGASAASAAPVSIEVTPVSQASDGSTDPMPEIAAEAPVPSPAATPAIGDFSATFPAADTGADALYSYQTDTVRIAVRRVQENNVTYFVADVYVKNIEAFRTAFAKGTYGKSIYAFPAKTASDNGAVFAVTGDYYSARSKGLVIRDGMLYRDVQADSACILYQDGEMRTYATGLFDLAAAVDRGVWQAWSFGPELLTADGQAITDFTSDLKDRHPRSAIGYYAPGHYCFVVVDGRQKGYSVGMRLSELSALFASLGCVQAYNLDGGATAVMLWNGEVINQPYNGGRQSGDIIWFA